MLEPPKTPSAPQLKADREEEGFLFFSVECHADNVGSPFGYLQLVSNSSRHPEFVPVPRGCGINVPTCYRFTGESDSDQLDGDVRRNATAHWWLAADASADGMALWCHVVHEYSTELSSSASVLNVPRMPLGQ